MMNRIAPILLFAVASGVSAQSVPKPKADLIFTHGNIYTGAVDAAASLGAGKRSEALAVVGDRILAVADVVEAMSSHRPYRPALGMPAARSNHSAACMKSGEPAPSAPNQ